MTRKLMIDHSSTAIPPPPRPAPPTIPSTISTATRIAVWIRMSTIADTKRDAAPASVRLTSTPSGVAIVSRDYWRAVRARWRELAVAGALLFGAGGLSAAWADRDPGAASGVAPGAYRSVTQPRPHGANLGLSGSERTGIAGEIFTNNIRVTLLAFALGVTAGIGTALLLRYTGLQLGVVAGLAVGSGNGRVFFELVTMHGVLELSCIAVASAAGLRLGWALIEPGRKTRAAALGAEAREAL